MKVLTNRPEASLLPGVASLLVQALATGPNEVFLISPWLKDVRLPLADVGSFRPLLGADPDEMGLGDLLALVSRRHTVHLVIKPPGELVRVADLKRVADKQEVLIRLRDDEELQGLDVVDRVAGELEVDIREMARAAATHIETLRLAHRLRGGGARLYFLDQLHAKLLWTPQATLVGSANFTNGGLITNDELMLEVTDAAAHRSLLEAARSMTSRAVPAEHYHLGRALARVGLSANVISGDGIGRFTEGMPLMADLCLQLAPYLSPTYPG